MKKLAVICCCTFLFLCFSVNAQYPYTPLIIEGQTLVSGSFLKYFPAPVISPGSSVNPQTFSTDVTAEYESAYEITLTDGFTAGDFNNSSAPEFWAHIDKPLDVVIISPDASHINATDGLLHVNKWEKLELGITLPQVYQTAIDNFFNHYFNYPALYDATTDLNPYAGDSLEVRIDLIRPDNTTVTKWAFYMKEAEWYDWNQSQIEEQNLLQVAGSNNPLTPYNFRLRFAPDQESITTPWRFSVTVNIPFDASMNLDDCPLPSCTVDGFKFMCDEPLADNYGYLHVNSNNNRYLKFDRDDKPFFGMGHNMANHSHKNWVLNANLNDPNDPRKQHSEIIPFKRDFTNFLTAIEDLHTGGANYAGMHLSKDDFAPEHEHLGVYDEYVSKPTCPGPYYNPACNLTSPECCLDNIPYNRQFSCWMFDKVIDKLREQEIYIQLCVDIGQLWIANQTSSWGNNAYVRQYVYPSIPLPDPLPGQFHFDSKGYFMAAATPSNAGAAYYWKRKYKYIMSRWGYSTNIAMILTFSEIDNVLGYHEYQTSAGEYMCCPNDIFYIEDAALKTTISDWHDEVITSYVKAPTGGTTNGLGETNHPFSISFTGAAWNDPDYCEDLFNNPAIDITDIHWYNDDKAMNEARANLVDYVFKPGPNGLGLDKPFHLGEASTYGSITGGIETSTYYNNHDISFHNMIWATAMQGGCTTGQDWQWPIIHRWRDANDEPPGSTANEVPEPFTFFPFTPLEVNDEIKPLYDNYTPLSEFLSQSGINFNDNFTPVGDLIPNDNIEYYMLLKSDKTEAYGWVHNINKYWGNNYYYTASLQNYYGCEDLAATVATTVELDYSFTPYGTYQFEFYATQNGSQSLPNDYVQLATADGKLTLDLSSLPLNCNVMRADYAFKIKKIPPAAQRIANTKVSATQVKDFAFTVSPNPNYGVFNIFINKSITNENVLVKVLDLTGRVVYKNKLINHNNLTLNLSQIAKGCYYVQLQISSINKIQKLIIQ